MSDKGIIETRQISEKELLAVEARIMPKATALWNLKKSLPVTGIFEEERDEIISTGARRVLIPLNGGGLIKVGLNEFPGYDVLNLEIRMEGRVLGDEGVDIYEVSSEESLTGFKVGAYLEQLEEPPYQYLAKFGASNVAWDRIEEDSLSWKCAEAFCKTS